jgi:hypothetical protein
MIRTNDLIDSLVADAGAVWRLAPPTRRALAWLALCALVFTMLALAHGVRPDLAERLIELRFVVGLRHRCSPECSRPRPRSCSTCLTAPGAGAFCRCRGSHCGSLPSPGLLDAMGRDRA